MLKRNIGLIVLFLFSELSVDVLSQNKQVYDSLLVMYNNKYHHLDSKSKIDLLSKLSYNSNNPDSALYFADVLLNLASKENDLDGLYSANLQKGHALRLQGNLKEALEVFIHSTQIAMILNNTAYLGTSYTALGDIYSISGNHENSIIYYKKAIKIHRLHHDSIFLGTALINLGDEFYNSKLLDSASIYYKQAGLIFTKLNYSIGYAYYLGNIGLVQATNSEQKDAEKNIKQAIKILEELGDYYPITVYQTCMAEIYEERDDFKTALSYAKQSYQTAKRYGFKEQIRDASLKLSQLYEKTGKYKEAFIYQGEFIAYKDSLINEETIRELADLRAEFEISQKQAEVDLLEKQKTTRTIILYGVILITLLVVVLAFVLLKNIRSKRKVNSLLQLKNNELSKQYTELEELNKTKDRFFSIVSHDLRGPVSSISGMTALIGEVLKTKDFDELEEITGHMQSSVTRLSALLNNLLDWALSQQGKFKSHPENLKLEPLVEETMNIFSSMATAKSIIFTYQVDNGLSVFADRNGVMTILRNLINNALKFTHSHGSVSVRAEKDDRYAVIKVVDTGIGIPKEKLDTIFELCENKSTWGTAKEKGLGLGLCLASEFTELNKGKLTVKSESGIGTTFTLLLPLTKNNSFPELL